MERLEKKELLEITGGGSGLGFGLIFGGIVVLISGIIDGFLRPLSCDE